VNTVENSVSLEKFEDYKLLVDKRTELVREMPHKFDIVANGFSVGLLGALVAQLHPYVYVATGAAVIYTVVHGIHKYTKLQREYDSVNSKIQGLEAKIENTGP